MQKTLKKFYDVENEKKYTDMRQEFDVVVLGMLSCAFAKARKL